LQISESYVGFEILKAVDYEELIHMQQISYYLEASDKTET
jgi:hypothetical protein